MGREGGRREEGGGRRSAAETVPRGPVAPADSGHRVLSSVRGRGRKSSPLSLDAHGPHSSRPPPGYRRGPHPTAPWSPEVGIALHKAEDPRAVPASWAPGPAPAPWREPRVTTAAAPAPTPLCVATAVSAWLSDKGSHVFAPRGPCALRSGPRVRPPACRTPGTPVC